MSSIARSYSRHAVILHNMGLRQPKHTSTYPLQHVQPAVRRSAQDAYLGPLDIGTFPSLQSHLKIKQNISHYTKRRVHRAQLQNVGCLAWLTFVTLCISACISLQPLIACLTSLVPARSSPTPTTGLRRAPALTDNTHNALSSFAAYQDAYRR
jgi:hypothetical protein